MRVDFFLIDSRALLTRQSSYIINNKSNNKVSQVTAAVSGSGK